MPGYVWTPKLRLTPRNGAAAAETIDFSSVFTVSNYARFVLNSIRLTYTENQDEGFTVNRDARATHFGTGQDIVLRFDISDMAHYRTVAQLGTRLGRPDWKVEISLDGGNTFREFVLVRAPTVRPFRDVTVAGLRSEVSVKAKSLIPDMVPIETGTAW